MDLWRRYGLSVCIASALLVSRLVPQAAEVALNWTMPTNNIDGTSLTDLAGAKIRYGAASSNYTKTIDVGNINSLTVTGLAAGVTYYFSGTAYNAAGLESDFCAEVAKTAFNPAGNTAPVVNAGPDKSAQSQAPCALNGTVSDDGLPAGLTLSIRWSKVSGPGTATFSNPQAAAATVVFSQAGLYTLRLTASDGHKTSSDEAVFDVRYQSPKKPREVN